MDSSTFLSLLVPKTASETCSRCVWQKMCSLYEARRVPIHTLACTALLLLLWPSTASRDFLAPNTYYTHINPTPSTIIGNQAKLVSKTQRDACSCIQQPIGNAVSSACSFKEVGGTKSPLQLATLLHLQHINNTQCNVAALLFNETTSFHCHAEPSIVRKSLTRRLLHTTYRYTYCAYPTRGIIFISTTALLHVLLHRLQI